MRGSSTQLVRCRPSGLFGRNLIEQLGRTLGSIHRARTDTNTNTSPREDTLKIRNNFCFLFLWGWGGTEHDMFMFVVSE